MWEAGRYCVITRLRTPLGDPVRTFESIERMLVLSSALISYFVHYTCRFVLIIIRCQIEQCQ